MARPANRSTASSPRARRAARHIRHAVSHQAGATAVEYALLITFIAAVCMGVLAVLGVHVHDLFDALHF